MSTSASPSSTVSASASASSHAAGLALGDKANTTFKIVGVCLAIGSGVFIGSSFVIKKKGLLNATKKYGNTAGEGHAYLKNWIWWTGMIMMVIGEILNFVAYAFTEAILVTPMGALSVVIAAILSHFFLNESLTFFGWIGCILCILGATILALNAPEQQSVTTIEGFKHLFIAPGFLVWMSLCIVASLVLKFYAVPKWGRTSMLPFVSICSLIGGISVSCTQGVGASVVTSIGGDNQVKNWFFWFVLVFVIITLLIEINYLNKALEIFNTALVVPVYFVLFTTCVLITSFILYQGLKASAVVLITMILGFIVICCGITLLQMSKVDPSNFKLDRRSTILLQTSRDHPKDQHGDAASEKEEVTQFEDPGMDALRGGFGAVGSIIRARSVSRRMSRSASIGGRWYDEAYDPKGSRQRAGSAVTKGGLNTVGMENLQRYQHSPMPMPEDAASRIAYHRSPTSSSIHSFPGQDVKARPHLTFGSNDMVHQYDPTSARHFSSSLPHNQLHVNTQNLHAPPAHLANLRASSYGSSSPSLKRAASGFETVAESPDEYTYTVGTAQRVQPGQTGQPGLPQLAQPVSAGSHPLTSPSASGGTESLRVPSQQGQVQGQGYEQGSTRYSVAPDADADSLYGDPYANLRPLSPSHHSPRSPSGERSRSGSMFAEGGFVRSLGSIFNFQPNPDLSLRPPASPRSGSPARGSRSGSGGEVGSRRVSEAGSAGAMKEKGKGAKGRQSEEEERRGLVEAGRASEEAHYDHPGDLASAGDLGYGYGRSRGPLGPRERGTPPRSAAGGNNGQGAGVSPGADGRGEKDEKVGKGRDGQGQAGLMRVETALSDEGPDSPVASPVRPAHSGF